MVGILHSDRGAFRRTNNRPDHARVPALAVGDGASDDSIDDVLALLRRLFIGPATASPVVVDDEGVRRRLGDGKVESVRWDELEEVVVVTTDEGPYVEDVFFLLVGRGNAGCAVPQGDPSCNALLVRLQSLEGFDNDAVIRAMSSTDNARFLCWKKPR